MRDDDGEHIGRMRLTDGFLVRSYETGGMSTDIYTSLPYILVFMRSAASSV